MGWRGVSYTCIIYQELPTNAFGQIEFDGNCGAAAKYVRLAHNSTMASVKRLLVEYWGLLRPRPHLALSIIGGAKNFKLDGKLIDYQRYSS